MGFRAQPVRQLLDLERLQDPGAGLAAHAMDRLDQKDTRVFAGMRLEDREMLSAVGVVPMFGARPSRSIKVAGWSQGMADVGWSVMG